MYFLFGFAVFHIFCGLQSLCTKVVFILWESFFMLVVILQRLHLDFLKCYFCNNHLTVIVAFTPIEIFNEFFCILVPPCATLKNARLV
jgi:hypothetical protein